MHQAIYRLLVEVAKQQSTTTYSAIAPLAGLDMGIPEHRYQIGSLLDEINLHERANGRPMLSAVVIREDLNMPGPGFFKLAKDWGLQTTEDDLVFFAHELTRVHAAWKNAPLRSS